MINSFAKNSKSNTHISYKAGSSGLNKRWKRTTYYLVYFVLFVLIALVIYSVFIYEGKSLVYTLYGDGHICFNSLVYYGSWLRTILTEHCIPMWDLKIGYGSDIFMTFSWETLGDPLNLLAVFFNADNMEYLYEFLAIFRIFLAGITFSVYSRYHGNKDIPTLAGSIMYTFCGFVLFAGVRDVYFMSPVIYLPLILMGIDKIFDGKKPFVLIIFTAIAAIANFYYFYMLTIITVLYAFFRFFYENGRPVLKRKYWLGFLRRFLSCALNYLIGVMIASVQLIPIIMYILGSERGQQHYYIPLFYSIEFYAKVFTGFISSASNTIWTHIGFAPIMFPAVIVMFLKRKREYTPFKVAFLMCISFMCIPVIGSFLNGMTYPVNRWIWAFSMLNAYIFVIMLDELFNLSKRELVLTVLISAVYGIICLIPEQLRTKQMKYMVLILAISVMVIIIGNLNSLFPEMMNRFRNSKFVNTIAHAGRSLLFKEKLVLICVIVGVIANGLFRFASFGSNYASGFVDEGEEWSLINDDLAIDLVKDKTDISTVRCDFPDHTLPMCNINMNHGINGTDFYFSLADGNVTRFMEDENVNVEMEHRYSGVDGRTILERLASVKYCAVDEDSRAFVPYGYEYEKSMSGYELYTNQNALSLGYTYDSLMKESDYDKLTDVQKQQAILQCAVVNDDKYDELSEDYEACEPSFDDSELKLTYKAGDGVSITDGAITVEKDDARITCNFEGKSDSETYLEITGLQYITEQDSRTTVSFSRDNSTKDMTLYSYRHPFNNGREDYIINLGYYKDEGSQEITITFPDKGVFEFSSIKAVSQSMGNVDEQTDKLSESSLENINIVINEISGTISAYTNKILCVSIPYSDGWTVSVDGKKSETTKVNDLYIGIPVEQGTHEIVLSYTTPYRNIGICISLAGLLLLVVSVVVYRRKALKS